MMKPSLVAHFHVLIAEHQVSLHSVSAIHDLVGVSSDPQIKQTVVLRRAVTQDKRLFNWYRETRLGKDTTTTVTVMQLDSPGGKPINTWQLVDAQPIRWTGPHFDALASELAFEELELQYDFVNWADK